jgi:hypothetical protein
MRRNVQGQYRTARSASRVEMTREQITAAAASQIERGAYAELQLTLPATTWYRSIAFPQRFWGHPALAHLQPYWQAWDIVNTCPDIPASECEFDRKGRGYAVNIDIYGYNVDGSLALVQVRRTEIQKYRNTTVRYYVTDGATAVEITNGKKALIKKAAQADPRPDSPLRCVRSLLPAAWQARIADEPIKFLSYAPKPWPAWKVYRRTVDDSLLSMYDDTAWQLGTSRTEKAAENHGGGYYVRTGNPDRIREQFEAGDLVNVPDGRNSEWVAVLVRCECRGRKIQYDSGKIAVSICKPVEIVAIW